MILGTGVAVGDAVDLVLDETGPEVHRERPMVDADTLPIGMSDDVRVVVEEGTPSVHMARVIFGHLAEQPPA